MAKCKSLDEVADGRAGFFGRLTSTASSSRALEQNAIVARANAMLGALVESMAYAAQPEAAGRAELIGDGEVRLTVPGSSVVNANGTITPVFLDTVKRVAYAAGYYCDVRVEVRVHSDASNDSALNRRMTGTRANEVRDFLTASLNEIGVFGRQVSAVGVGSSQPTSNAGTPEARSMNRRVEFILIQPPLP